MVSTDRLAGVTASQAIKVPVKAATTANITLAAEQTIDGVSIVEGDRVLVKDQSTATQNGIYIASTGSWSRAPDFDGARDVVTGTLVSVNSGGTTNGGTIWEVTTTGTITIDTSSLAFTRSLSADLPAPADPADDGKVLSASGGGWVAATLASLGAAILSAANTFLDTVTIQSSDSGASAAPDLVLYRNSSTPADSDALGRVIFRGRNDGPGDADYIVLRATGLDVNIATGQDAQLALFLLVAGTSVEAAGFANGVRIGSGASYQGTGTLNVENGIYVDGTLLSTYIASLTGLTTETVQATTSGTSKVFSIPAGTTRITVLVDSVSLDGTDDLIVQVGDAGGLETSGYASVSGSGTGGGTSVQASTAGFIIECAGGASSTVTAKMVLDHMGSNRWLASFAGRDGTTRALAGGGDKTLTAELTQVALLPSGSDGFDAGQVTVVYE